MMYDEPWEGLLAVGLTCPDCVTDVIKDTFPES
jgi:hypothetical protein